jgi:hypothetical protein
MDEGLPAEFPELRIELSEAVGLLQVRVVVPESGIHGASIFHIGR